MLELQKAVSEAERKAHEMISSERAKMERTVAEAKRQAAEDALSIINQQEDSSEVQKYKHTDTSKHQEVCPQSFKRISPTVIVILLFGSNYTVSFFVLTNRSYSSVRKESNHSKKTKKQKNKVNHASTTLAFHHPLFFFLTE